MRQRDEPEFPLTECEICGFKAEFHLIHVVHEHFEWCDGDWVCPCGAAGNGAFDAVGHVHKLGIRHIQDALVLKSMRTQE